MATAPKLDRPWFHLHAAGHSVPAGARHGGMVTLNRAKWEAVLAAFDRQ